MAIVRTDYELFVVSCLVVFFGSVYVLALMAVAHGRTGPSLYLGWLSVLGASIIFSTTTIPFKAPQLQVSDLN